jgi:DNA-binding IclR family transcriptional regulator
VTGPRSFKLERFTGQATSLPRSNVRRCLDALISEGVIRKEGEWGTEASLTGSPHTLMPTIS